MSPLNIYSTIEKSFVVTFLIFVILNISGHHEPGHNDQ